MRWRSKWKGTKMKTMTHESQTRKDRSVKTDTRNPQRTVSFNPPTPELGTAFYRLVEAISAERNGEYVTANAALAVAVVEACERRKIPIRNNRK